VFAFVVCVSVLLQTIISERASALLRYKMEHDPEVKDLGIKGVYQLQGGIDKYFKEFSNGGGYWKGKNYTFDKRFAHEPTTAAALMMTSNSSSSSNVEPLPIGQCEACRKPWDRYRGKRRCPACGVPSLVCKDCYHADQNGSQKLDKTIRCDLCVEQGIFSKTTIRHQEAAALHRYEERQREKGLLNPTTVAASAMPMSRRMDQSSFDDVGPPSALHSNKRLLQKESSSGGSHHLEIANPDQLTRLYLKNMCRKTMTEDVLVEHFPSITHIVWNTRKGAFLGQGWVEMESPTAAAEAIARSGEMILGRPLYIEYQAADSKDLWPPPKSAVR
jgi:Rhodanase C-terminal